jgi:hypothetical protein
MANPKARTIFRWLAGLACPFFLGLALVTAFPNVVGSNEAPSLSFAVMLLSAGGIFGMIAATGRRKWRF